MTAPVSLHVWRLPARALPGAVAALARARSAARAAARTGGFVKLLGTSSSAFVPWAPTPTRWVLLSSGGAQVDAAWWDQHADEQAMLRLRPVAVRGTWDGRSPFAVPAATGDAATSSPVVAVTRATLRPRTALRFYRDVPAVAAEVRAAPGCRVAFGVGEAPVLRQGTLSIWDSTDAMRAFAHGAVAHRRAIRDTAVVGWYAEELFARFAVEEMTGTIDGVAVP